MSLLFCATIIGRRLRRQIGDGSLVAPWEAGMPIGGFVPIDSIELMAGKGVNS